MEALHAIGLCYDSSLHLDILDFFVYNYQTTIDILNLLKLWKIKLSNLLGTEF
jgi:hypothetical protein